VRRLSEVCRTFAVPLAAAALQFSLRDPRIASTIVGATRPERLAQTLELAQLPLPAELWSALDSAGFSTADPEAGRWKA
jgi:D-threo-aldose 1-dehydrogenase